MKYVNISEIMTRAHEITRAAIAGSAEKISYSATFAAALRICWDDAIVAAMPARAADEVRAEWDALTPADQYALVQRRTRRAARDVIGYSVEDEYNRRWEDPAFSYGAADLDDYYQEAFARVLEALPLLPAMQDRRASRGQALFTLESFVKACGKVAIMRIFRAERRNGADALRDCVNEDDERASIVETLCAAADDTAREVVFSYAVDAFRAGRDERDNAIIDGIVDGLTVREIADRLGVSHVAVVKRVKKIRAGMIAAGIAPASWIDGAEQLDK